MHCIPFVLRPQSIKHLCVTRERVSTVSLHQTRDSSYLVLYYLASLRRIEKYAVVSINNICERVEKFRVHIASVDACAYCGKRPFLGDYIDPVTVLVAEDLPTFYPWFRRRKNIRQITTES
jgi:hypothetical protein